MSGKSRGWVAKQMKVFLAVLGGESRWGNAVGNGNVAVRDANWPDPSPPRNPAKQDGRFCRFAWN